MLLEVQKVNKAYRDLQALLINQIQQEYAKMARVGRQGKDLLLLSDAPLTTHSIFHRSSECFNGC